MNIRIPGYTEPLALPAMTAGSEFPSPLPKGQVSPGIPNRTTFFPGSLAALGAEFSTRAVHVWATSCPLPTLPGPFSLLPLAVGTSALSPCSDLPLWDIRVFVAENLSKSAPHPEPGGVAAQIRGSPLALLLLKPSPGGPGLRPRPGHCLTPALGSRRGHRAKRRILVLGDSDAGRRYSPGRQLV